MTLSVTPISCIRCVGPSARTQLLQSAAVGSPQDWTSDIVATLWLRISGSMHLVRNSTILANRMAALALSVSTDRTDHPWRATLP